MADSPLQLSVTRWGEGPLHALLLHGLTSNAAGWWRFGPDLASWGFTVIAPDLRGHGATGPADHYSLSRFAQDLYPLRDGWDLVVGHSLGGGVAAAAASGLLGWTDLLVLEDPWLAMGDPEVTRAWLLESFAGEMSAERVQAENPRWAYEDCVHKAEGVEASSPEMVNGVVDDNLGFNLFSDLEAFSMPTLLMGAGVQPLLRPDEGHAAAEANPAIEYVQTAGSAHSIHRDSYPAFRDAVHRFILEA